MSLPEANINNTGSLAKFLESIKTAGIPDRVTFEFLKTLGFKSSNDRPIIAIMKAIGFLDANSTPTELYKAFRGHDGPRVLAKALNNAYSAIFLANTKAEALPISKLKSIIASKSTKGDATVERIARTFQVLTKAADFSVASEEPSPEPTPEPPTGATPTPEDPSFKPSIDGVSPSFHYNLEIHLPTTTDISVYNAIFKSLKENLL